jgi:hypothetical protein
MPIAIGRSNPAFLAHVGRCEVDGDNLDGYPNSELMRADLMRSRLSHGDIGHSDHQEVARRA